VRIHSDLRELLDSKGIRTETEGSLDFNPAMLAYQEGKVSDDEFITELARWLAVTEAEARQLNDAILIEPFAGTEAIVDHLHQAGIATGCLSNTNSLHWSRLTSGGNFPGVEKLQTKVASHLAGLAKPDPAIFHHFAAQAGVAPIDVIYFEDTLKNIEAAQHVGFDVVRIDPKQETAPQIALALAERGLLG